MEKIFTLPEVTIRLWVETSYISEMWFRLETEYLPSDSQRGSADEMALYIDMSSSYIIDDLDA
jgi:hypothetical protein